MPDPVKYIKLKKGVKAQDLLLLKPEALQILAFVSKFAWENDLNCVITSLTGPARGRITKGHKEGRHFDIRSRNWPIEKIKLLEYLVNQKFKKIAAIGRKSGLPMACIYHKVSGNVYHFHFQVRP